MKAESTNYYIREGDLHSVIAVINTKTSNIASINEREYLDGIFENMIEQYEFDVNNAAIYYLFDWDSESNTDVKLVQDLINTLKNARENDNNMQGGMLILSYPSVEAYEISNFMDHSFQLQKSWGQS